MRYNECLEELEKITNIDLCLEIMFGKKYILTKEGEKIFRLPHNINKFDELDTFNRFKEFKEEDQKQMIEIVNKLIATGYISRF